MAICFTCSCGQPLHAPEELAGKRIHCPHCRRVVEIPAATPAVRHPVAEAITETAESAVLLPREEPGNELAAAPVVSAAAQEQAEVRSASPASVMEEWTQTLTPWAPGMRGSDWEIKERRRDRDASEWLLLILFLGIALLAPHWFSSPAPSHTSPKEQKPVVDREQRSDLELLPLQGALLAALRPAELAELAQADTPLAAEVRRLLSPLEKSWGLPAQEIVRICQVYPPLPTLQLLSSPHPPGLIFLRTRQPYDRVALYKALTGQAPAGDPLRWQAYPLRDRPGEQVAFLTDRVLVLGDQNSIKSYLESDLEFLGQGPLQQFLPLLEREDHLLVVGLCPVEWQPPVPPQAQMALKGHPQPLSRQLATALPPLLRSLSPLADFQFALLTLDHQPGWQLQAQFHYLEGRHLKIAPQLKLLLSVLRGQALQQGRQLLEEPEIGRQLAEAALLSGLPASATGPLELLPLVAWPQGSLQALQPATQAQRHLLLLAAEVLSQLKIHTEKTDLYLILPLTPTPQFVEHLRALLHLEGQMSNRKR